MFRLSCISLPNFVSFLQVVLWAAIDFQSGRITRMPTDTSSGARESELETPNLQSLMLRLSSISLPNFITFLQALLWAATDFQSGSSKRRMSMDTSGGAREFELETPNLRWLMLRLSSISLPNLTSFLQAVLWVVIDFHSGRRRRTPTDTIGTITPSVLGP
ncbi:hypothetical protein Q8A67_003060 [Cirrhinus molitorella]|uniref:Uncharacterized protein n=1 Tax=Cirrhinus molitorella TaxID=172907 RepID=A0AA88Q8D0_9TELE|nr:hypothetical protein Q8A67_003060 [Cirrhinus molitorella]